MDSGALTQMPGGVLEAMNKWDETQRGNVHRGVHGWGERATAAYEGARSAIATCINAEPKEIVFTTNCTESLNMVARCWAAHHLQKGDVIALTILEHHSNMLPWLQLKDELGVELAWIGVDAEGHIDEQILQAALSKKPKLLAVSMLSNVLGTAPDVKKITNAAHGVGAKVVVDAAQAIAHLPIDVRNVDCDALAFSSHKTYGPTGCGVLYVKNEFLIEWKPFLTGGGTVENVTKDGFTTAALPHAFEAGTPPITQAIGLAAALTWSSQFPWNDRLTHEQELLARATDVLKNTPGIRILGPQDPSERYGCISFVHKHIHAHDLCDLMGQEGVILRAGNHCAQPLHKELGIPASCRFSVALHTTGDDLDRFEKALHNAIATLS